VQSRPLPHRLLVRVSFIIFPFEDLGTSFDFINNPRTGLKRLLAVWRRYRHYDGGFSNGTRTQSMQEPSRRVTNWMEGPK
jgi:hypothetical protein